jgi:hypothetical protein
VSALCRWLLRFPLLDFPSKVLLAKPSAI